MCVVSGFFPRGSRDGSGLTSEEGVARSGLIVARIVSA